MTQSVGDLTELRSELRSLADPAAAAFLQRYFRTAPGGYGEGDRFLGIRVPRLRALVRRSRPLPFDSVLELVRSSWHEERLLGLLLMVDRYRRDSEPGREVIHQSYLHHLEHVDSWDLVDVSAPHLLGAHLDPGDLGLLEALSRSGRVWDRRIAILATLHWIRLGEFRPALRIAELLVRDTHDLVRKGVGWMLREVGRRDRAAEEAFLRSHAAEMPRTMLRYAIERFPPEERSEWLKAGRIDPAG
jgi:3-methyladenine DNA glycosylase AlkD